MHVGVLKLGVRFRKICFMPDGGPLTNSMEQRRSWEANSFSASQEIPRILWRFITVFTRARHLSIQSMPPSHFYKIHFNIQEYSSCLLNHT
jgi:hypothetical protein